MPLFRRLPKRGFNSLKPQELAILNLEKIQNYINKKIIKNGETLNLKLLITNKLLSKKYDKLKILSKGEVKEKINIETDYISKNAKDKLEKVGCSIVVKNNS